MIRIKNSKSIDMLVTPSHRVLVFDRKGDAKFITASELKSLYDMQTFYYCYCYLLNNSDLCDLIKKVCCAPIKARIR
jgi:hypothetical protein